MIRMIRFMIETVFNYGRLVTLVLLAALLAGCFARSGGTPYWAIKPVHVVRNSPIPVPRPAIKPQPPIRSAAEKPRYQPSYQSATVRTTAIGSGQVRVERGDTVYGIARTHSVPLEQFIALNNMEPPYLLQVGQVLNLPGRKTHHVARRETAYSIARRYDLDVAQLAVANNLSPPYLLRIGQTLYVPPGRTNEMTVASRPSHNLPSPPPRTGNGFDWPVAGTVISRYGVKEGGLRNDGVNIRAPKGAPVRAAESGIVAYAGSGLRGFGNLVLIRHDGDWVTAYGHNDGMLVKRGDAVRRGQMIARVGSSGGVTEPQLHFEIRRGTKAVDPATMLPRLSADAR